MSTYATYSVKDNNLVEALQGFFKNILSSGQVDALLVPLRLPGDRRVMPTLVTDPESLNSADPLAPCFPLNAARIASKLTRRPSGRRVGLVMRPCEIRAFVELIKLKQASMDDTVLISLDCLGALTNTDYAVFAGADPLDSTRRFVASVLGKNETAIEGFDLAPACRVCEHPVSRNADIGIGLFGVDTEKELVIEALTPGGETCVKALKLKSATEPSGRKQAVGSLVAGRITGRDAMFERVSAETSSIGKLSAYLSACVNCYNCRVACPVCYCKECVFVTDVFDHDPFQYLAWASARGSLKMPSDTDFFHLTRMAHIGLTCVGCGQCSNACPNDIPLVELFRTVAHKAQQAFDYEAGRRVDEPIPLSVFEEKEYEDVVGVASSA